jgi:hypothetical protein
MARKLNKRTEQSETQQALPVDCTALYIRVSTDQQVEGFSLDEQQRRLHQFCQGHECSNPARFPEDATGRP